MTSSYLSELMAYAQNQVLSTAQLSFIEHYFDKTDPDEIMARGASKLFQLASSHWRLVDSPRQIGKPSIAVFNPSQEKDGLNSEHTLVQIVNDNMPFLVDSVTMAINRSGRTAHWIVHPLMSVTRGADGKVSAITPAAKSENKQNLESFIMVECDRIPSEAERAELAQELENVLNDVRKTVVDWKPMLKRMTDLIASHERFVKNQLSMSEGVEFLRWLEDNHFTFLGARDYDLKREGNQATLIAVPDSGLGILQGQANTPVMPLPPEVIALIDSDETVLITKAMTRATVHRPSWLDYIAVKRFNEAGQVIGETRFLGLYTSTAYSATVSSIPQIRQRVDKVMQSAGVVPHSHAAKALQAILDEYPRDELFQVDMATLSEHAVGILRLQERQRVRAFTRRDPFGRFTSVQVFVPRERFNTELRMKISELLLNTFNGTSVEFTPTLTDSPLARIHYLVKARDVAPTQVDIKALEAQLSELSQRWEDLCGSALLKSLGDVEGAHLAKRFANELAFPLSYREATSIEVACKDIQTLAGLHANNPLALSLSQPMGSEANYFRFRIYNLSKVALSDSLPVLEHMGARVLDEHPYQIFDGSQEYWIHDLGLQLPNGTHLESIKTRFENLFAAVWRNEVESDDLNKLVLNTQLTARSIAVLRACARYFKQLGFAYSQNYIEAALYKNHNITQLIAELFGARFKPDFDGDREVAQKNLRDQIEAAMAQVASLDEDKILRQYIATIMATFRTNLWQTCADGSYKPYMSFKLNPREVPGVPEPKPMFEIWVYSPRVEGVHLRGGKVARGGLRWSDRREDFRTEILGLVKAQQVKNTVIVPVGSKGGFVLKNPPPPSDREAFQAEGIACYKTFLSGLLDVTDNIVQGKIVPPQKVVRHDPDDPYLVVAADKGTATFSDIANGVSSDYGFWLGDAFASGGSVGYDHKKMGITARGAWESVKRHFRSLNHNTQTQAFTVAGIGDMSGDVFGNGMLLSEKIKLVLAFDHRHIFIDPNPDPARSFAERSRMFNLPRSSWDDYDKSLISQGGGVYPRTSKSITLSPEAKKVLDIETTEITPNELLKAILQAPVDLLYNGGIGTYVKASFETHAQVGDKASDAFRVNGKDMRCKVMGEGGNLGCTQNGRIEFAQCGGRIYTDAIDNSAGVDCSDHEVNIKILLGSILESGALNVESRNTLLASMTEEVGHLVLTDNYYQTQALDIAGHRPVYVLDGQQRLIQSLEKQGRLNRTIEFLPTDEEFTRRKANGKGLTAPENAVVMAYAKMAVFDELIASNLPDDPFFSRALKAYFPKVLSEKFADAISQHPLKREIIATYITNHAINRAGATFVNFLASESAASTPDVIRAFTLAREIFDLETLYDSIDALDYKVDATLQLDLFTKLMTTAQRAARWMLRARNQNADMPTLIQRYQPGARELRHNLDQWLPASAHTSLQQAVASLVDAGVDAQLAHDLVALEYIFPALDLVDVAQSGNSHLEKAARTYFAVESALNLNGWREQINRLGTDTLWQTQARASARDDVYSIASQTTKGLLQRGDTIDDWHQQHLDAITRLNQLLTTITTQGADLAPVSVALRELRGLA